MHWREKKKIDESSTKVIIEKMQKENIRRKNKQRTVIMLIIITVLACGIILVRQIGKIINSKDTPVFITNEDGEKDEKITAEDLEECRDELYAYINEERSKEGMGEFTVMELYSLCLYLNSLVFCQNSTFKCLQTHLKVLNCFRGAFRNGKVKREYGGNP